ncbi:MAG TPA: IclR family transcriptional regulator C-terminal domain-containing protein [Opitutaceae bacterium]|nr:IclR family transcriptional regulator C-terminal domain-containing protein [Opitutaceae bacterium]
MPKSPDYPVPALEKGLDILEALAAAAVAQSLADLAVTLERSRNELFRMLNCLERRGYVTRDPVSAKYSLSLKLFSMAHGHSVTEKLLSAARVPMQALTERSRESCHLSVLDRGRLLVVAQQESPERVRLSIEVGSIFDAERTASGRLLLAHLQPAERAAALAEAEQKGERPSRGGAAWENMLAAIRAEGISTAESETIQGVRDVAVLVGDPGAGVTAALAVTRLHRRGEKEEEAALLAAMRAAAADITRALGLAPRSGGTGTEG